MSLSDLLGAWTERDNRYSLRRLGGVAMPLTPDEVSSIKHFRWSETTDLSKDDQRLAQLALNRWTPPGIALR